MSAGDPRIDAFIAKAQPFARPILTHLRAAIHRACPGVEESIKWGRPAFVNDGRILAVFGAFKAHASLTLWKMGEATGREEEGMGQFGRLTGLHDLPDEAELIRILQATASARAEARPQPKKAPRPALPVPEELAAALAGSAEAQAAWDGFAPSHRRRLFGMGKRSETARDARGAGGAGDRMDRRGQAEALAISALSRTGLPLLLSRAGGYPYFRLGGYGFPPSRKCRVRC